VHLDRKTIDALFGAGYILKKLKNLLQPGQYVCEEFVTLEGPKGRLKLRVLGPVRGETQVELSITDVRSIGLTPSLRLSGDLAGTPGAVLAGSAGHVQLRQGVIVAARHLHISAKQAEIYGLADGDSVRLQAEGPRGAILDHVVVRAGDGHDLELHIDFDEANCAMIGNGDLLKIIGCEVADLERRPNEDMPSPTAQPAACERRQYLSLVTERDLIDLVQGAELICARNAIITPLARDVINQKNIRIRSAE